LRRGVGYFKNLYNGEKIKVERKLSF